MLQCSKEDFILYAVTDRGCNKDRTVYEQVENAIDGGVTFVQLREKNLSIDEFIKEAKSVKELCYRHNVPFVINDNIQVALESGADGVHLGQEDGSVSEARKLLGNDKIIGVSAHNVKEALIAEKNGADYLGVGAAFPTTSKANVNKLTYEVLCDICSAVKIPVVAIGGINLTNINKLAGSGINGVAVISALFSSDDVKTSASNLRKAVEDILGR